MQGFTTRAVHGRAGKKDVHGALRMPVYDTVAFEHDTARSLQETFEGRRPAHVYTRISNPTVEDLEQRLRLVPGGNAVLALASGMAAVSTTILALAASGTNVVTTGRLFGNTLSLFEKTFQPWGLETRYADMTDPRAVEAAIDRDTRLIFLESITNPRLEVADCAGLSRIAHEQGVPLVVDNTLMTPCLFNTGEAGVDIEILSSTKAISGGATSMGGIIIDNGNFDWGRAPALAGRAKKLGRMAFIAALRQEVHRNLGACLSPHNAYLQSLGLETLALRLKKACANALTVADFLAGQPEVAEVHYPGRSDSPFYRTAARQFRQGFGCLLTFDLAGPKECFAFMNGLELIRRATNLNDNKSLILHPASTIFAEYSPEEKEVMGIRPTMLRLSVGIEDHEDLLTDLQKGFRSI